MRRSGWRGKGMLKEIGSRVHDILLGYGGAWPTDITDRVFLAIEGDQLRAEVYWDAVAELDGQGKRGQQIVNQYIGKRVKDLTTGVNRGRCYLPRSSLIKSYETH